MCNLERIDYSYRSTYDHRAALGRAEYKRLGWRGQFLSWGFYICLAVAVAFEVIILRWSLLDESLPDAGYRLVLLGGAATIAAMICAIALYCIARLFIGNPAFRDSELRLGSLSMDGITEERGSFKSWCGWTGIIDIERMPKLTLLLLGDGMGYIIPHDALPEGVNGEALHNRIDHWRKEAR